ncbi:hypothetical protein UB39_21855 [Photobacterium angustum]|nr:hypothetical protein UB39_21855 [Photobacterium angustum]
MIYRTNSKEVERRYIQLNHHQINYPTPTKDATPPSPSKLGSNSKLDIKENNKDLIPIHFSQNNSKKTEHDSKSQSSLVAKDTYGLSDAQRAIAAARAQRDKQFFIDQLSRNDYPFCYSAMQTLKEMKDKNGFWNIYLGSQKKDVWDSCEYKLEEIDQCNEYYDEINSPQELTDRLLWNIYTDRKLYDKDAEIGLPFFIDPDNKSMNAEVIAGCDYLDFLRGI